MTATLPLDIRQVFERFITTEFVTIDGRGQPIAWPVTPYYHEEEGCIDVTTGLGYPKKADDADRNKHVALLFSDPTGSGLDQPPQVLVQGTAVVDDKNLKANRERYLRESRVKLPATKDMLPPEFMHRFMSWYLDRIYVHVRPERVYVWPQGDSAAEPTMYDAHLEEVRAAHNQEPEEGHAPPEGGGTVWDSRIESLGSRTYPTAVLAMVGPDGFPFAVRVPVRPDPATRMVHVGIQPWGAPFDPGLACLVAHDHAPDFTYQRNFQVRGDLVETEDSWALVPHKVLGGFELPPGNALSRYRLNAKKMLRFRKIAKREQARRASRA